MDAKQLQKIKMKTKLNVKNWRDKKGNELFKTRYKKLRDAGFSSYEANQLKYQSDQKIEKLIENQ